MSFTLSFIILIVANKTNILSVVMLNGVMLNVVAPLFLRQHGDGKKCYDVS